MIVICAADLPGCTHGGSWWLRIDPAFAQGEHTGNAAYAAANDKNFHAGHKRPKPI